MKLLKTLCLAASAALAIPMTAQEKAQAVNGIPVEAPVNVVPAWGNEPLETDSRVVSYILPKRIMWTQSTWNAKIENQDVLLKNNYGQAALAGVELCHINNAGDGTNSLLFDFGRPDVSATDNRGLTSLDIAMRSNNETLVRYFLKKL